MGLKLLFFVCLAVTASAVSEDDYDSYDGWWSQEVPSADLGIVDSAIDKLVDNDQGDYPLYDTSDETPDNGQREEEVESDDQVVPLNDSENSKSSDEKTIPEGVVANDENVSWDELKQAIKYDSVLEDENVSSDGDKDSENVNEKPNEETDDKDYLVEDNRSDVKDEEPTKNDDEIDNVDGVKDYVDLDLGVFSHEFDENLENIEFKNEQSPDVPSKIVEEAEKILEEENGAYEEDIEGTDLVLPEDNNEETNVSELDNTENEDTKERLDNMVESFINEMEKDKPDDYENNDEDVENGFEDINLLKKYGNDMIDPSETDANDETINSSEQEDNDEKEQDFGDDDDEDTVDKVYQDLNADLDKLFATWDKLTADDSKLSSEETNDENGLSIEEYEEKYGRPYREGLVLNQRDNFNPENYDDAIDSIIEDKDSDSDKYVPSIVDLSRYLSKEDENTSKDISKVDGEENTTPIINYVNDKKEEEEMKTKQAPEKALDVDNVTEKEYADLIFEFSIDHHDEIATNVQDESVSPIYMTLEADKTIEITSPNYPGAYPANNVVDWILEGEESVQGIELNITDLDLRGAQGDYLLINPGGARDGQGLLFTYHLPTQTNLRQYRFTSTNRLYIRFNAGAGLNFLPGFRLTVKPIWSLSSDEEEDMPDPEALLPAPAATLTVNLGGLRYPYFYEVKDIFRRIVADMATMYINANSIDPGMNTTLETTQITNIASCNVNWPSFEECVAVTFGVPLFYEMDSRIHHDVRLNQEDLISMWMTYVKQDPFAARLRVLGITEFAVPNDNHVMMMWAVLGVGIFIAATILGFALWRFSCFEGYSRMKEFDTNSLSQGKRGLDLYPTPHQPLPPLYADSDYKWADSKYDDTTRVDLGGFANRSYARDELLEIDSDEDNIAPRDRYTTDV